MPFERFKLQNNADVFLVPLKDNQSTTVLIMLPVGSRYETKKLSGAAHFIEHLLFKGTKKRPSTLILTREIDRLGADYNAFTSKECTGYYIKVDKHYAEVSLDILSDMLFGSLFVSREMEKEKKVIVEELRMYHDNPLMRIGDVFGELMYQNCPLGWHEGGTEKTVAGLTRDNVLSFRDRNYQPANMTIVAAGGVDGKFKNLLEKYFGERPSRNVETSKYAPAKFGPRDKKSRVRVESKKTDQAQLMLGFPAFHYNDPDNPALAVLHTVLGGSMSSRLFIKIRERLGLAYMVKSDADFFRDTGYFSVRAGLEAKNINKVLSIVKNEAEKVVEKGVTARELKDAKTHLRGGLILSLENSSALAEWYAFEAMFKDKIKTPEERLNQIDAVSNEDIKRAAKRIFDFNEMRVAVVGEASGGIIF
ncbi:MAG: insulinase family protein [Candidatus Magasanikbacteria bacterium]|nr:insulinase family protein [Candidatus Magasanikbacteria bacterium]